MRKTLLVASLLAVSWPFCCVSYSQSERTFISPNSVLLFEENVPKPPYIELLIVSKTGTVEVPPPEGYRGTAYTTVFPALSPSSDRIAWGLSQPDKSRREGIKSVLGVYSMLDRTWKVYGEFCEEGVGSIAFSPDGTKIAFASKSALSPPSKYCFGNPIALQILDIATGKLTPIKYFGRLSKNARLTWSPSGRYLAGQFCCSASSADQIVVIDLTSGEGRVIAEGTNPSWSPKGDLIAFQDQKGEKCILARPDGTNVTVIQKLQGHSLFLGGAIWSPNGEKLLFNEEEMDSDGHVAILDLATRKVTTLPKHTKFALGWAAQSR